MLLDFSGKGFFVFSDPGGAKPVLALADTLKDRLTDLQIISDRHYPFYADFLSKVKEYEGAAYDNLQRFRPDFLFTGTSYTSTIELDYIKAAEMLSIPSYAFVDHWTSIRERFSKSGEETLPGHILLIDERAKKIALEQGLEESLLSVFENPYHQYIRNWRPAVSREAFMVSLGIGNTPKRLAVFAPDPLSNINGKDKYGFDEITATIELSRLTEELQDEYWFLLKPHPNQNMAALQAVVGDHILLAPQDIDTNTLIFYSDVVIGFFSNFLIEADVMKKKVIRFLGTTLTNDPFDNSIGKVVFPDDLQKELMAK